MRSLPWRQHGRNSLTRSCNPRLNSIVILATSLVWLVSFHFRLVADIMPRPSTADLDTISISNDNTPTTGTATEKINNNNNSYFPLPLYGSRNSTNFMHYWNQSHFRIYNKISLRSDFFSEKPKFPDPTTMLLGIITETKSRQRRNLIRETYLNFYKDIGDSHFRICSLQELISNQVDIRDCPLTYVFVAAGGTNESSPHLLQSNVSTPITVPRPTRTKDDYDHDDDADDNDDDESDVIYLNVRDNMNEGKIPTWFHYASSTLYEDYHLQFDYIAKVDHDTVLFTGNWMDLMERDLQKPYQINKDGLVYGGFMNDAFIPWQGRCHEGIWEKCPLIGPLWMIGPLYFLSRELALYITSNVLDHDSISSVEDVTTGSMVWSHPGNVTVVELIRNQGFMSYDFTFGWTVARGGFRYQHALLAHSENACWNPTGPYFKQHGNVRKVWREYLAFLWSDKNLNMASRYTLYDYAPPFLSEVPSVVHSSDYIYSADDFDASPIVVEKPFHLVFFPISGVADVTWRCLIRRLLGYDDWEDTTRQFHGLRYLSDYTVEEATSIIFSPNFTKAMFVRNPLLRIQSNFIQMAKFDKNFTMIEGCDCARDCNEDGPCLSETKDFVSFLTQLIPTCDRPYWRPQANRMEPKYYRQLDFIGRYESFSEDAETLLRKVIPKPLGIGIQDDFPWVHSDTLQELLARFDVSYNTSDAPELFNVSWKDYFLHSFQTDLESSILNYKDIFPSAASKRKKQRMRRRKKKMKMALKPSV